MAAPSANPFGGTALPPIDLAPFLDDPSSPAALAACAHLADTLVATSALVVRDPRVSADQNDRFLNLLERYYAQPRAAKVADERPEVHFQVRRPSLHAVLGPSRVRTGRSARPAARAPRLARLRVFSLQPTAAHAHTILRFIARPAPRDAFADSARHPSLYPPSRSGRRDPGRHRGSALQLGRPAPALVRCQAREPAPGVHAESGGRAGQEVALLLARERQSRARRRRGAAGWRRACACRACCARLGRSIRRRGRCAI